MKNFSSICANEIESLCLGKFDAVHIGHQELFSKLDAKGGVLIIDSLKPPYLTPRQEKWIPHPCFKIELNKIKDKNHQEFAEFLKKNFPNLRKIIVGYDFRFGKDRSYSPKDLEEFFDVCLVDQVNLDGMAVHRQHIFQALSQGQIKRANAMLGRIYSIKGKVISGQGRGKNECFPTLNLETKDYVLPKSGVYATLSKIDGVEYKSVSFIGHRLSSDGEFAIETHLLGTCFEDQASEVEIFFIEFLRENEKFSSFEQLKAQIAQDIARTQEILFEI